MKRLRLWLAAWCDGPRGTDLETRESSGLAGGAAGHIEGFAEISFRFLVRWKKGRPGFSSRVVVGRSGLPTGVLGARCEGGRIKGVCVEAEGQAVRSEAGSLWSLAAGLAVSDFPLSKQRTLSPNSSSKKKRARG